MARFLCAVHAPDATPRAYALVEQLPGGNGPAYAVRDLRTLDGDDPTQTVLDALAAEPQYAAQTVFVMTGGQKAVDALHERGPSAVAVTLIGDDSADADALDAPLQVLVDTFEWVFRDGDVEIPGSLDEGAGRAVAALHAQADLEAAAPGSDRDAEGDLDGGVSETMAGTRVAGSGPDAVVVEQSGNEEQVSTETVRAPVTMAEASAAAVDTLGLRVGRVAASTSRPAPDLGDHADAATALALAVWYGETSRDELPATDKLDEAMAARNPDDSATNRGQQKPAGRS